ncbi:MAG: YicC family protein [Dysgonamonadaceae bacterium]|nr:YicC family protein [Dysgonamonadaceae bacterium]
MIRSMTGFGKAETEYEGKKIRVEIKSLNSKQLDLTIRLPNIYREKELELRTLIQTAIERGKVDLTVSIDGLSKTPEPINAEAVKFYYKQIKNLSAQLGVEVPHDWFSVVFSRQDVTSETVGEADSAEWDVFWMVIGKALDALNEFRIQEGLMLEAVLKNKITAIENLIPEVEQYEAERIERLKSRIIEDLSAVHAEGSFDNNRFEQEMFYYIEKIDVSEEKSRLINHLKYFTETIHAGGSQGRKLGFISQEIGREINTLGSKSNHALMQQAVVRMKDELEQIKEQIFNVL